MCGIILAISGGTQNKYHCLCPYKTSSMLSFILHRLPPCKAHKGLVSIDLSSMYRVVLNALLLSLSRLVVQCIMWTSTFKQVGFILDNCQTVNIVLV